MKFYDNLCEMGGDAKIEIIENEGHLAFKNYSVEILLEALARK